MIQFGKNTSGIAGQRTITLPISYTSFYCISTICRDNSNNAVTAVKLLDTNQTLSSFVGIASWSMENKSGYTGADWDWITIGS